MISKLLAFLCAVVLVRSECPLSTPAMLWSTSKSGNFDDVLRSDTKLLTVLRDSQMVIVFYHPVLSVDQFSKRADVYNAHSAATNGPFEALLLATREYGIFSADAVSSGERLIALIEGEAGRANKRISKVSLTSFNAAALSADAQYIFVALPEFEDSATFSTADLGELVRQLGAQLKTNGIGHTMVYTGLHNGEFCPTGDQDASSDDAMEILLRRKRQVSSPVTVTNNSYTYINVDNCLLLFSTTLQFGLATTSSTGATSFLNFVLPPIYSPGNGTTPQYNTLYTSCSPNVTGTNMTASLAFNYSNVASSNSNGTTLNSLSMFWQFNQTGTEVYGNWYVTQLSVTFEVTASSSNVSGFPSSLFGSNITVPFAAMDTDTSANVYAPIADSFHCTTLTMVPSAAGAASLANVTSGSVSASLQINDFQIQPFLQPSNMINGMPQFGAWNDCDMFFTIPILMSFFTMLLMLFVLLFAFCVFSTVTSYDRFDDKNSVISLGIQDT